MNPCCQDPAHLGPMELRDSREDLTVRRCDICGSRHIEAVAEPGQFGFRGADRRRPRVDEHKGDEA